MMQSDDELRRHRRNRRHRSAGLPLSNAASSIAAAAAFLLASSGGRTGHNHHQKHQLHHSSSVAAALHVAAPPSRPLSPPSHLSTSSYFPDLPSRKVRRQRNHRRHGKGTSSPSAAVFSSEDTAGAPAIADGGDDDGDGAIVAGRRYETPSSTDLPPWLEQYASIDFDDENDFDNDDQQEVDEDVRLRLEEHARINLNRLRSALESDPEGRFSSSEIDEVLDAVHAAAAASSSASSEDDGGDDDDGGMRYHALVGGTADFVRLLLSVEEESHQQPRQSRRRRHFRRGRRRLGDAEPMADVNGRDRGGRVDDVDSTRGDVVNGPLPAEVVVETHRKIDHRGIGGDYHDADADRDREGPSVAVTRDALVAAAFHYCDCVEARRAGVYDLVRRAMKTGGPVSVGDAQDDRKRRRLRKRRGKMSWEEAADGLGGAANNVAAAVGDDDEPWNDGDEWPLLPAPSVGTEVEETNIQENTVQELSEDRNGRASSASPVVLPRAPERNDQEGEDIGGVDRYGEGAARIARGAAKIKRAEIIADAVYSTSSTSPVVAAGVSRNPLDADLYRSLLLSLSEDWNALALRCVACLYRLRGILAADATGYENGSDDDEIDVDGTVNGGLRSPFRPRPAPALRAAREALRVYAPLAQRLGMHRLKTNLEGLAFRILYRRQHAAATALYGGGLQDMQDAASHLTEAVEDILAGDEALQDQVDGVSVYSRVKEPFSLWRKLLKLRVKRIKASSAESSKDADGVDGPDSLSIFDVPDAIALRVVLRARKLTPQEHDDTTRIREQILCYYVQKLLSERWPATDLSRIKDYIRNPKANGYQSLHYTASLFLNGEKWPFEVQVRSEEMHRIAEFGVAAHWDYKLQGGAGTAVRTQPMLALPAAAEREEATKAEASAVVVADAPTHHLAKTPGGVSLEDPSRAGQITSYIDALTTAREDLVQKSVFIFVSPSTSALSMKVLSLPSGSTVTDALDAAELRYGIDMRSGPVRREDTGGLQLFRNGVPANLDDRLGNGDVLTIPVPEGAIWKGDT